MRLVADSGLWSTGPVRAATPLVAVLEVSGAVLSWTFDEPATRTTRRPTSRSPICHAPTGFGGSSVNPATSPWFPLLGSADDPRSIDLAGVDIAAGTR